MQLPNNIAFALASAFSAAVLISAASNASEAVFTATNTFAAGDFVEYTGGWGKANGRVFRLKAATATSFTAEGLDTGSVRKITTWVPIVGVTGAEISGGDGKNVEVPLLDTDAPVMLPDGFTATTVTLTTADDKSLPHHAALKKVSDSVALTCLRGLLPGGGVLLYAGYCSFNESPSLSKGSVMAVKSMFSLQNKVVRY
jgi:hypothetical protein